jgi:hypothetical protein
MLLVIATMTPSTWCPVRKPTITRRVRNFRNYGMTSMDYK